jgi:hypothetical protein
MRKTIFLFVAPRRPLAPKRRPPLTCCLASICARRSTPMTGGSTFVKMRNDRQSSSRDAWVFRRRPCLIASRTSAAGILRIRDVSRWVGLAVGGQTEILSATDRMIELVGGDPRRVVPVREDRFGDEFHHGMTEEGLRPVDIPVAEGEKSRVETRGTCDHRDDQ